VVKRRAVDALGASVCGDRAAADAVDVERRGVRVEPHG
jgi:hypothetical protein